MAVARGLPGVARREAALWAERSASDRLAAASSSALGANAAAAKARASVFDDVLDLVAARARRDELTSSAWAGRQPYRSLAPYGVQDADLFVGSGRSPSLPHVFSNVAWWLSWVHPGVASPRSCGPGSCPWCAVAACRVRDRGGLR